MGRTPTKPKKYACFTPEEQAAYEKLNDKQRRYIDYRGQGYSKKQSYAMCGYISNNPCQASYALEKSNKLIVDLTEKLIMNKRANDITVQESDLNKRIDALALQEGAEKAIETIEGADGETARRIQFYRDIMNGKIKTVKKTTTKDAHGIVKSVKFEEITDVGVRINARKELDRILGLNVLPDIDKLQIGGITVNIVDASKKEELDDERNKIVLEDKDVEFIDGEKVVCVEDNEQKDTPKKTFDINEDESDE